jgi:hypothetical protein
MYSSVQLRSDVRSLIDADGAVLLDLRNGTYFSLNNLGADIWRQLEAGEGLTNIQTAIAARYGIASDLVKEDIQAFVADLAQRRLIDVQQ